MMHRKRKKRIHGKHRINAIDNEVCSKKCVRVGKLQISTNKLKMLIIK